MISRAFQLADRLERQTGPVSFAVGLLKLAKCGHLAVYGGEGGEGART